MTAPDLSISISRTALSLPALVMSGRDDTALGVTSYEEPAIVTRNEFAPDNPDVDGAGALLSSSYEETNLVFSVTPWAPASEAVARALVAELREAVTRQLSFTVTVTVADAPPETWACTPGSLRAGSRSLADLRNHNPVWSVVVPAHPVPTI